MLLLLLVLVAVGVAVAGLLGIGVLSAERRQQRTGLLVAVSAPAVLAGGVAMLAMLVLGVGAGGGNGGDGGDRGDDTVEPTPVVTTVVRSAALPDARVQPVADAFAVVPVDVTRWYQAVGGLAPGGVVRVKATGFGEFERGLAEQCVTELARHVACGPALTVQFGEDGRADFLFVLRADISPGGCRMGAATCLLRVRTPSREAVSQTVLGDRYEPGQVVVGRSGEVTVTGFPAGSRAAAVLCGPSPTYDARRCSEPLATFTVDGQGAGRTAVPVGARRVGTDGVACGPRHACWVMVVTESGYVAAPGAAVSFPGEPGVAYAADRVLIGILIAVVLLGVAAAIALKTDWSKPTEAATPDLDGADLQADDSLDDLFGTDEELDVKDPIPW